MVDFGNLRDLGPLDFFNDFRLVAIEPSSLVSPRIDVVNEPVNFSKKISHPGLLYF